MLFAYAFIPNIVIAIKTALPIDQHYVESSVLGVFEISHGVFGPTEMRLLLAGLARI